MGTEAWVSRSCVLGVNSLRAQMVVLELLKAADHLGTMLGMLICWPRSWRLLGALLLGTPGAGPTDLGPSVVVPAGQVVGASARY